MTFRSVAVWRRWCSRRRRPRPPTRLGDLTSFGAAPRSPPVPSGPSGALHTSGAGSLFGSSTRRLEARPGPATHRHRSLASTSRSDRARDPTSTTSKPTNPFGALHAKPSLPSLLRPQPISHVIPPQPFQTLNSERWNCNVFRVH